MRAVLRVGILLMLFLVALAACATPTSSASAPASTPTLTARQQVIEAAPSDRLELVSGHYQVLMLYSPL